MRGEVVGTLSETGRFCLKNVLNWVEWINGAYGMLDGSLRKLRGGGKPDGGALWAHRMYSAALLLLPHGFLS